METLVWLHPNDTLHTYGIEAMGPASAIMLMEYYIADACKKVGANYFHQGKRIDHTNKKASWVFIEFFGEGDEDKILKVIAIINYLYGEWFCGGEVQMEQPSREQLEKLGLM